MQARAYLLLGTEDNLRSLLLPAIISMICHLIFFALIIYSPSHLPVRKTARMVVNVNLVALSQIQTAPVRKGSASGKTDVQPLVEKAPPPKAVATAPVVKPASPKPKPTEKVSLAPKKWSEKTSLKKETFQPSQAVKRAIKQIEEQAEESRPRPVAAAIDRIRERVGQNDTETRPPQTAQTAGTAEVEGEAAGAAGGSGEGDGRSAPEILVYQQEIAYHIRNNWVYPEQLAGQRKDLEARMVISIMASGEIKDVRFEKRSGNSYLDDSAYKAVLKSNPLPALPKGYQFYTVILGFTPAGLQ